MSHKEGYPGKLLHIQPKAFGASRSKITSCCCRLQVTSEQLTVGMVLQPWHRTNRMHIYIKKLAQMIMEAGRFQKLLVGTQEMLMLQFNSPGWLRGEARLRKKRACFVLLGPSVDWMRSTGIMEEDLLYSRPTGFNANLIQKHPHRNFRKMFDHIPGRCGPTRLRHKFNHHTAHISKFYISQELQSNKNSHPPLYS